MFGLNGQHRGLAWEAAWPFVCGYNAGLVGVLGSAAGAGKASVGVLASTAAGLGVASLQNVTLEKVFAFVKALLHSRCEERVRRVAGAWGGVKWAWF